MYFAAQLSGEDPLQQSTAERLCLAASLVEQAAPWASMPLSPIVAIQHSPGSEPDFLAFRPEERAVSLYPGWRGLAWLHDLQHAAAESRPRLLLTGREAIEVNFDPPSPADPRDLPLLENCWRGPGGPIFRSVRPGYWPWFVNELEALRLAASLEALASVSPSLPESESGLPLLLRDGSGRWAAHRRQIRPLPAETAPPPVLDAPAGPRAGSLCVGDRILPGEFESAAGRPAVLHVVAAVEAGTGDPYPLHLRPPGQRWSTAVRRVVAQAIHVRAAVPECVLAPDPGWSQALLSLARAAGFAVQLAGPLPELEDLFGDWEFGAGSPAVH